MEELPEKLDRIQHDVQKLLELYNYAEKLYPYEQIKSDR